MPRKQTMAWTMTLILSTVLAVGIANAQKHGKRPNGEMVAADIRSCSAKHLPVAQCRAVLTRKYGKPTAEDSSSIMWDKYKGAEAPEACYSFAVEKDADKISGHSFMRASCQ